MTNPGPLTDRPKPIIACICSDFHEAAGGGFNLIRISDSMTITRPEGFPAGQPLPVLVRAVTCWTEGIGQHTHQLRLLDQDAQAVVTAPEVTFALADFNRRFWVTDQIIIPVQQSTRFTVAVTLDGDPQDALRYVFTVEVV